MSEADDHEPELPDQDLRENHSHEVDAVDLLSREEARDQLQKLLSNRSPLPVGDRSGDLREGVKKIQSWLLWKTGSPVGSASAQTIVLILGALLSVVPTLALDAAWVSLATHLWALEVALVFVAALILYMRADTAKSVKDALIELDAYRESEPAVRRLLNDSRMMGLTLRMLNAEHARIQGLQQIERERLRLAAAITSRARNLHDQSSVGERCALLFSRLSAEVHYTYFKDGKRLEHFLPKDETGDFNLGIWLAAEPFDGLHQWPDLCLVWRCTSPNKKWKNRRVRTEWNFAWTAAEMLMLWMRTHQTAEEGSRYPEIVILKKDCKNRDEFEWWGDYRSKILVPIFDAVDVGDDVPLNGARLLGVACLSRLATLNPQLPQTEEDFLWSESVEVVTRVACRMTQLMAHYELRLSDFKAHAQRPRGYRGEWPIPTANGLDFFIDMYTSTEDGF